MRFVRLDRGDGLMPRLTLTAPVQVPATAHPVLGDTLDAYSYVLLGDAGGLTQFGAHLEVLPPGARSSLRHWHETEDELVYILSGEVWLIEDTEELLRAGDAAAWPAGHPVGHCLENRGTADAVYLVVGTRNAADSVHYPDHDVVMAKSGRHRRYSFADGRTVETTRD